MHVPYQLQAKPRQRFYPIAHGTSLLLFTPSFISLLCYASSLISMHIADFVTSRTLNTLTNFMQTNRRLWFCRGPEGPKQPLTQLLLCEVRAKFIIACSTTCHFCKMDEIHLPDANNMHSKMHPESCKSKAVHRNNKKQ